MEDLTDRIAAALRESASVKEEMAGDQELLAAVARAAGMIVGALRSGGKLVIFGNGGSAADAQHIACELVGRYMMERRALPAIALTTNTSCLTAIGNDYSFDEVFARQVRALVRAGDVAMGISTSGRSRNVILGMRAARELGAGTVGLTGADGGELCSVSDVCVRVPSRLTPRIQEAHIAIGHIISEIVEVELFGGEAGGLPG
ncbi:MAG: D-sedoheptulose 7-phosphate isomerase [Conexivisphaerales archaeon]|nr:D-sedoheptulose 7-phosphate isomerase [Conexivisphaerales archaeon]